MNEFLNFLLVILILLNLAFICAKFLSWYIDLIINYLYGEKK